MSTWKPDIIKIRTNTNPADGKKTYEVYRGPWTMAWFEREDDARLFVQAKHLRAARESGIGLAQEY